MTSRVSRALFRSALLIALAASGCSMAPEDEAGAAGRLVVANGGNFADQNGTLSRVDLETGTVTSGPSLDGFVQGLEPMGNEIAILINTFTQGRIDFAAVEDLDPLRSVTGIDAPRDAVYHDGRLYVTAFAADGSGSVLEVDPATATVLRSWPTGGLYPEGLAIAAGRVVVARYGLLGTGSSLAVIDPSGDGSVSTLDVECDGPRDVHAAADDQLVVVCQGKTVYTPDFSDVIEATPGRIVIIDGPTMTVSGLIDLDIQPSGSNGTQASAMAPDGRSVFVLDSAGDRVLLGDLAALTIDVVPTSWQGTGTGLSGVAVEARKDRLFVGRLARGVAGVPDFTALGSVVAIEPSGEIAARFVVGASPTHLTLLE